MPDLVFQRHRRIFVGRSFSPGDAQCGDRAGIDHALHPASLRCSAHSPGAFDVRLVEIFPGVSPEAVQRRGVEDPFAALHTLAQAFFIVQVAGDALNRQTVKLAGIGTRTNQRPHLVTGFQQPPHQRPADKTRPAGDEGFHCGDRACLISSLLMPHTRPLRC